MRQLHRILHRFFFPASDVYALGAVLYTLLTGRPPFHAATPLDTSTREETLTLRGPQGPGVLSPDWKRIAFVSLEMSLTPV